MKKLENSELQRKSVEEFKEAEKTPFVVVLDNVRSMNNIGSVFRTSDAFLVESLYLCGITATPPDKEIHKTALGATETVNWKYYKTTEEAVIELKNQGYKVYAVEQVENSIFLSDFQVDKNEKYALIFGHEVKGVSQEVVNLCQGAIEIPQAGTKHSLNISVSAGIVVWDLYQKLIKN